MVFQSWRVRRGYMALGFGSVTTGIVQPPDPADESWYEDTRGRVSIAVELSSRRHADI
jgi:hypothetical protein